MVQFTLHTFSSVHCTHIQFSSLYTHSVYFSSHAFSSFNFLNIYLGYKTNGKCGSPSLSPYHSTWPSVDILLFVCSSLNSNLTGMAIADITLLSGFEVNTEHLDGVSKPPPHQIISIASLCHGKCTCLYVNDGTHCTPDHPWKEGSPTLRPWGGGVINTRSVKPFETVPVIKGCTNQIELDHSFCSYPVSSTA